MGITDNVFCRKSAGNKKKPTHISQQYRLDFSSGSARGRPKPVQRFVLDEGGLTASGAQSSDGSSPSQRSHEEDGSKYPRCVCYRDSCVVTCDNLHCNWTGVGRVRSLCSLHPSVTFLLDLPQCPRCAFGLREIPDRPVPTNYNIDDDDL